MSQSHCSKSVHLSMNGQDAVLNFQLRELNEKDKISTEQQFSWGKCLGDFRGE